jgi:hypothetical protein
MQLCWLRSSRRRLDCCTANNRSPANVGKFPERLANFFFNNGLIAIVASEATMAQAMH